MSERKSVNPWLIFVLICVPILIGSIDLTSIVVVLPQATLDLLGPKGLNKASVALWAVTAYLLSYTISLALVGRLSDVVSRKRIFIGCIVIFICGSLWAGLATELPLTLLKALPIWPDPDSLPLISLIIGRIIQAIGAGASVSVGMALVSDIFPPEHRAEPISLIGALDSLGWVVGNLYAGIMLQILPSWRWLFLINAGVATIALIFTFLALRGVKVGKVGGHFDLRGAVIFASSLIALTIGIELLNDPGPLAYGLIASSIGLFILFGWLQLRTRNSLIDMSFIRKREVRVALLTNMIVGFGLILIVAGVPLVINLRSLFLRGEGLLTGALRAGVMLSALTLPLVVAVLIGEGRYRRLGAGVPVAIGLGLAALGFLGTNLWTYTAPTYVIALPLALVGLGLGLTIGPLSLVVVDAAEESSRGLASSLVLTMRLLGMTFGTPPAASLTLKLANDWAYSRAAPYADSLRDIAHVMLVPPMATDALTKVMLAGAVACILGLVLFYLPRAYHTIKQTHLSPRAIFSGAPILILAIIVVGGIAVADAQTTPTIVPNPIARQLPPNVEFYAGVNLQQMFLQNTKRPLDSVLSLLSNPPTDSSQPSTQPINPQPTPTELPPSPLDNIVRGLFRPRRWLNDQYKVFCTYDAPPDQWQNCFSSALLGWIGPQAAFALLPRTRADFDYVFVFQATNRNNAIQFASNLATSLGEKEPSDVSPTIRILTINAGTPDERRLAITEAYVIIGTPKAVEYTLNHGNLSLADQLEYQTVTQQLPPDDFATFYVRSSNFDTDLKPALNSVFHSPLLDAVLRIVGRAAPLFFTRTTTAPTLLGLSMRVNEHQLMMNMVANFPFSLQKLNASPVSSELLSLIPASQTNAWAAANLNIAEIAREVNIDDAFATIARESENPALRNLLTNEVAKRFITNFGQALQTVLTHARGQVVFLVLPDPATKAGHPALVIPLVDTEKIKAADTVAALKTHLQFLTLSGALTVNSEPSGATEIVTIGGQSIESVLPGGFQYTLTENNLLVISSGNALTTLNETLKTHSNAAVAQVAVSLPGALDKFLYAYFAPSMQNNAATLLLGGEIRRQALYLTLILQTQ